jgi:hypothetical protein
VRERLPDDPGHRLEPEERDRQGPAVPDEALVPRPQRIVELEQVGFRLLPRDPAGRRQVGQDLQGAGADVLVRSFRLDHTFEGVEIAVVGADQDPLEGGAML